MLDPDISTRDALRLLTVPDDDPARMGRRRFLQLVGMGVGAGAMAGPVTSALGGAAEAFAATPVGPADGIVVLVGLFGGLDGLNTVVPYTSAPYYQQHGSLAIPANQVLKLGTSAVGLHPSLPYLKSLYDRGEVAVVQGVGYPDPDLSHFTSMAYWMQGHKNLGSPTSGWIGRWLDGLGGGDVLRAITVGQGLPLHLVGNQRRGMAVPQWGIGFGGDTDEHDLWMYDAMRAFAATDAGRGPWHDRVADTVKDVIDVGQDVGPVFDRPLPDADLEKKLTVAARLINADLGLRVVDTGYDGFDTHADQPGNLVALLTDLDRGLRAFFTTLDDRFRSRVTIMTYSEFGRTSWSNDSAGTDHGTSNNHFVIGRGVKGGLYGKQPSLVGLERWDRMPFHVDFRSMYASVLDGWMGGGSSTVLGGTFTNLGLFKQGPGVGVTTSPVPTRVLGDWVPLPAARVYDSRLAPRLAGLGAGTTGEVRVAGMGGVPATGVTAVALNVTALGGTATSTFRVWPTGAARPASELVSVPLKNATSSLVTVNLGKGGRVNVFNDLGAAHCTVDVVGYFRSTKASRMLPLRAARLMDSRSGLGGRKSKLWAGTVHKLKVRGVGGVPLTADTVAVSITAIGPSAAGSLTAWPSDRARPIVPTLQFVAGGTVTGTTFVKVAPDGTISIRNATGSVHVTVDVLGCFVSTARGRFMPVPAARLLDTRPDSVAPFGPAHSRSLAVLGKGGVPATGVSAVVVSIGTHGPSAATSLVAWPYGTVRPIATNLYARAAANVRNLAVVKVGSGGRIMLYNTAGTTDVTVDVVGYFTS